MLVKKSKSILDFDDSDFNQIMKKVEKKQKQSSKVEQAYTAGDQRYIQMQVSVIDTGVGISEEGCKKLFMDFAKLDENSKRNCQGTGLGLSICKNIIEQMGGSVDVKSKIN